ncbi:MAG: hypothetical protein WKF84_03540 [Pyrinomonadaceae bacterium]
MPLVTSGQFAYVFKLKVPKGNQAFGVRCFRGFLGDRDERYREIDAHLRAHPLPSLSSFEYDREGIFVSGRKFPTLVMEWISGPTLDVYINEVIGRRDVLLHLADEWVRLIQALRERHLAHGDLQHGNVIVEAGRLRLVDLDGMYVPAMNGWEASEVGHQHYQHPQRNEKLFNEQLDRFSALVIYLSLISLAERPKLWSEHHDENLLFTKTDFLQPDASALFEKIKDIGSDHRQLAELLAQSARSPAGAAVPDLLDYAAISSKLPAWMHAPADLAVVNRTREATKIEVPIKEAPRFSAGGQRSSAPMRSPVTPNSQAVQSVFSGAPQQTVSALVPAPFRPPLDLDQLPPATFFYAKQAGKSWVPFIWVWLIAGRHFYEMLGISSGFSVLLMAVTFPVLCYLAGLGRATYYARDAIKATTQTNLSTTSRASSLSSSSAFRQTRGSVGTYNNGALLSGQPTAASHSAHANTAAGLIVASRTQGIYSQTRLRLGQQSHARQSNQISLAHGSANGGIPPV